MGSTFISYRRKDWAFAQRLVERLERRINKGKVFIDIRIEEDDFERVISREIKNCDLFILVLSERTLSTNRIHEPNDWIRKEILLALNFEKPIILAMIEDTNPPDPSDLPEEIREICSKQSIEFYPAFFDAAMDRLVLHGKSIAPTAYIIANREKNSILPLPFHRRRDFGHHILIEHLKQTNHLKACGYALDRFTQESAELLQDILIAGGQIQYIVVASEGTAEKLMTEYDSSPIGGHNIELTLSILAHISKQVTKKQESANIEIRVTNWIPSCGMYICKDLDNEAEEDWAQIEIYPPSYDTYPGNRPVFTISSFSQAGWFDYFDDQFDSLWNWAQPIDIE